MTALAPVALALILLAMIACGGSPPPSRPAASASVVRCGTKHADPRLITANMTLGDITSVLGEPDRDIGSALFVLEWDCSDGSRFFASLASLEPQTKPNAVGFNK